MRFGFLAMAVAAATAGVSLGYYATPERSGGAATTRERTVTVTRTVVRTIVRPDRGAGRRVFVTVCSRCHSLVEPEKSAGDRINLAVLQPSYQATIEQVTSGGIAMPAFRGKLSKRQIRDVAAFVAAEAARRGRTKR